MKKIDVFLKTSSLLWGMVQTIKYIIIITNKDFTKIANFLILRAGFLVLKVAIYVILLKYIIW